MAKLGTNILEEHTPEEILEIMNKWYPSEAEVNELLGIRLAKALINANACVEAYEAA
ncbi:hypothetical protein HYT26_01435 [Candidatus Pacearchaeota archaeon]|nr:hypothetical protein [Candidatus Pacearchaeota archaeon]